MLIGPAPDGNRDRNDSMSQQRLQVVVLGAGFGGLACAKTLSRADVDITLIDRQNYHCFQPLLYQVATAAFHQPKSPGLSAIFFVGRRTPPSL